MMVLHADAPLLHGQAHSRTEVISDIGRKAVVVTRTCHHLESVVIRIVAGCIVCLWGIDACGHIVVVRLIADVIEDVKLVLRSDDHLICDPGLFHILECADRDVSRILVEGFILRKSDDLYITDHRERRHAAIAVNDCGIQDRNKDHVGIFDGRIPVITSVKTDALLHRTLAKSLRRNRKMCPSSVDIGELKIDHLDTHLADDLLNVL